MQIEIKDGRIHLLVSPGTFICLDCRIIDARELCSGSEKLSLAHFGILTWLHEPTKV